MNVRLAALALIALLVGCESDNPAAIPPDPDMTPSAQVDGELAWRQHDGGHEDRTNMKHFLAWASAKLGL